MSATRRVCSGCRRELGSGTLRYCSECAGVRLVALERWRRRVVDDGELVILVWYLLSNAEGDEVDVLIRELAAAIVGLQEALHAPIARRPRRKPTPPAPGETVATSSPARARP